MRAVWRLSGSVTRGNRVVRMQCGRRFVSDSNHTIRSTLKHPSTVSILSQSICHRSFCVSPKSEETSESKSKDDDETPSESSTKETPAADSRITSDSHSDFFTGDRNIPPDEYEYTCDAKDMPGAPKMSKFTEADGIELKKSVRKAINLETQRLQLKDAGFERETKPELSEEKKKVLLKAFDHCCDYVEKHEPQLYETLKYLKGASNSQKLAICVLRNLNNELNQVRADANNAQAAKLRLQWWQANVDHLLDRHGFAKTEAGLRPGKIRDPVTGRIRDMTLDEVKSSPKSGKVGEAAFNTPVLRALAVCVRKYNLNGQWLRSLTTARASFLNSNTFLSLMDLEEYAENTQGLLLYLSMEVLGCAYNKNHSAQLTVASHIAALMTYVSVIRSIPLAAANGFISLPDEVSMDFDVYGGESEILKGNSTPELQKAVEHLCIRAYAHLLEARKLNGQVSKPARALFLCSVGPERYLKYLEKKKFNVFDSDVINYFDMGFGFQCTLMYRSKIGWY